MECMRAWKGEPMPRAASAGLGWRPLLPQSLHNVCDTTSAAARAVALMKSRTALVTQRT